MESFEHILSITGQLIPTIGVMFLVYNHFRRPDIEADKEIQIGAATCSLKHKIIDENYAKIEKGFGDLARELSLFKENGLNHIEAEQRLLRETQVKILTILEERNKKI